MLNENIRTIRKNKGFTQEELAIRLHVTRQTISKWEKGLSVPDAALLSDMAEIFEVSVSELLGEKPVESHDQDAIIEQLSRINEQMAIRNRRANRTIRIVACLLLALIIVVATVIVMNIAPRNTHILLSDHIGNLTYTMPDERFTHDNDDIGVTIDDDGKERISAKSYKCIDDMTEITIWEYGDYDPELATVFFVVMTMKDKPQALLYMLCFVWYEYILAQIFLRITTGEHGSRFAYPAFLILSILPLTLHKILIAMNGNAGILAIIGISYMTFKAAQIIIEISDGIIKELKPDEYIYLMLFFPTLLSGPIDRSRRFEEDIRRTIPREEYLEMAGNGLLKILLGMVYKLAIASVFYLLMKKFGMDRTLISAAIYMYTFGFYLFFDFAGYSLMAVGTGYLLGVKVPDNFNKPFLDPAFENCGIQHRYDICSSRGAPGRTS